MITFLDCEITQDFVGISSEIFRADTTELTADTTVFTADYEE